MNILVRRIALSAFVAAAGLAGANVAFAMDPMKPTSKSDCMKHASMEKDATKKDAMMKDAMMKECDSMAMKKGTMKSDTMKKSGTSDAMGTMAPKKK